MFSKLRKLADTIKRCTELTDRVKSLEKDNLLLRSQLKACMGIDQGWHDWGKIVIMMHLKAGDVVKIIDVKSHVDLVDYRNLCKQLEAKYGTPPKYIDTPGVSRNDFFRFYTEGRW